MISDRLAFAACPPLPAGRMRRPGRALLLGAALLLLAVLLSGCRALSQDDVDMIRTMRSKTLGDANDESLPLVARDAARVNWAAWCAIDYSATGREVPAEARELVGAVRPEKE